MKILCVNNWQLQTFPHALPPEVIHLHKLASRLRHKGFAPRFGRHQLPIDTKPLEDMFAPPQNLAHARAETFAVTNDQRCHELVSTKRDRPWLVWWSGGIDSTAIITALLRHPEVQFRNNVTVCVNELSVLENPRYFYRQILPNFKVIHGQEPTTENNLDFYHVSGALGDQLCGPDQALHMTGFDMYQSYVQAREPIIKQLSHIWQIDANWFYQRMKQHIESVPDSPVSTCADFFWWFNHTWPWYYMLLHERDGRGLRNIRDMQTAKLQWYNSYAFHAWAWHRARPQFAESFARPERFKQELKDYTWMLTGDNYFRYFKTKCHSDSRKWPSLPQRFHGHYQGAWVALDQDLNPYFTWDGIEHAVIEHFKSRN